MFLRSSARPEFRHRVWMGMTAFAECVEDGRIELDGLADHLKAFPSWFKLSIISDVKLAVRTG